MKDFEKFDLNKKGETIATDNTLSTPTDKEETSIHDYDESAWPLPDMLKKLVDGCDILLHKKDYDGPDHEEILGCVKLAKRIIKRETVSKDEKWISVKDRLPEFGKGVLVYFKNKIPKIKISSLNAVESKRNVFVVPYSGCIEEEFTEAITHWQPLPSPPINK